MRASIVSFSIQTVALLIAIAVSAGAVAQPKDPVLELDFEQSEPGQDAFAEAQRVGKLRQVPGAGPTSPLYQSLPIQNSALQFVDAGDRLVWTDPGEQSQFDFTLGDDITIEAWVKLPKIAGGKHTYILSKGRTYEKARAENHNFALRLTGSKGNAVPSFLFSTQSQAGPTYHRWTASKGFGPGQDWHHVAVTYRFGEPESIRSVVDGEVVPGKWDMGGATKVAPIVSNESVWLGSSRGGDPGNSFVGWMDRVRLHRTAVPVKELKQRYQVNTLPPEYLATDSNQVLMTIHESAGSHSSFPLSAPKETMRVSLPAMAIHRLPLRFQAGGLRKLWKGPVLVRMYGEKHLTGDEYEILLRAPGLTRLWVDGEAKLETSPRRLFPNAHQPMIVYEADMPWLRVPRVGDQETRATIKLSAGKHRFVLETLVGSSSSRCEMGETLVAFRQAPGSATSSDGASSEAEGDMFRLLLPGDATRSVELTDQQFVPLRDSVEHVISEIDSDNLAETTAQHDLHWEQIASRYSVGGAGTDTTPSLTPLSSLLDGEEGQAAAAEPLAWLRRVSLDTRGIPPTLGEIKEYLQLPADSRNEVFVDRFLSDSRWADHWTSYWQDVLAENPSILKPSLNNTGPFRYWIHDSLRSNKPIHRIVGELIRMQGDIQAGGPAGFSMAAQNDVPMAEKAHVVASAFLAVDLKCARCHDAPYHPWKQKQLFEIAAMLRERPIKVPSTSSVPRAFFARHDDEAPISITLFPGDTVDPAFPASILEVESEPSMGESLGNFDGAESASASGREQLIRSLLSSDRFAQVVANRVWDRFFGWGLVSSADDWYDADVRHPRLLAELSDYLVATGFDWKRLQRQILLSDVYARAAIDSSTSDSPYTAPWQRRLTAEQVVDSMHWVTGIEMSTETISFDPEASQKTENFLNLGVANRAWQLISLSNERDRPSLALPKAAAVVECLEAFGWRASRQSPQTHRPQEANLVQPGVIANGDLTTTLTRLTPDSLLEQLALESSSPEDLTDRLFLSVLTRKPTEGESAKFTKLLSDGFEGRVRAVAPSPGPAPLHRGFVTWSNHFDVKANLLRREQQQALSDGPKPSARIDGHWRRIAEDALWALINSPEFQLVP